MVAMIMLIFLIMALGAGINILALTWAFTNERKEVKCHFTLIGNRK